MKLWRSILLLCLCNLLTGCWSPYWGKKHFWNSEGSDSGPVVVAQSSVVQPPSGLVVFTVSPPGPFQVYASASLATPKQNWSFLVAGTNTASVQKSVTDSITNQPSGVQGLDWDASPTNQVPRTAGYKAYWSENLGLTWKSEDVRKRTQVVLMNLPVTTTYYAVTAYDSTLTNESLKSAIVIAMPQPVAQFGNGVFFYATPTNKTLKVVVL